MLGDPQRPPSSPPPAWIRGASWLAAPLVLAAVVGAFALLRQGPEALFTIILVAACALPLLWLFVSIALPAASDRKCPECGVQGLERLSEEDLHGVRCTHCGFEDEHASAWKFAEEGDQALEPFVLRDRGAKRPLTGSGGPGASA